MLHRVATNHNANLMRRVQFSHFSERTPGSRKVNLLKLVWLVSNRVRIPIALADYNFLIPNYLNFQDKQISVPHGDTGFGLGHLIYNALHGGQVDGVMCMT